MALSTEAKEFAVVGAVIVTPILLAAVFIAYILGTPSGSMRYMTAACDGLRGADSAIAESDRDGVSEGWSEMTALDPAGDGDGDEVGQADLQKGWAAYGAVQRTLSRWDQAPGPDAVAESDQPLIDRGLETCERFDYEWYSPYQVFASP